MNQRTPYSLRGFKSTAFSAIGALLLSGLCAAGTPGFKGGAMLDCSGLPCVDVTASTAHLKLLVDTGDARSLVDLAAATRLKLQLTPILGTDGKPRPNRWSATLKDLRIGDLSLGDINVMVLDLQPSLRKGTIPAADGFITYPAFVGRALRMDYKNHRVEASEASRQDLPCPRDCGTLTTPTFGHDGPPIVASTGFTINGRPLIVQIDTLYAGSMLVYPTSVDTLGLGAQAKSAKTRFFPYTDDGVNMIEGEAHTVGFGRTELKRQTTLYFATADVHLPDALFDGTVGNELFLGHVLTFDFRTNRFWIG
jgi:Aspartyl protease